MFCATCLVDVAESDLLSHVLIEHLMKKLDRLATSVADLRQTVAEIELQLTQLTTTMGQ